MKRNSEILLRVICVNLKELLSIIEEIWKHFKKACFEKVDPDGK